MRSLLFVIDAGALIKSTSFVFEKENGYLITSDVDAEIKDLKNRLILQQGIDEGLVSIPKLKPEFVKKAEEKMRSINSRVSKADISVLAIALQLKSEKKPFTVITDDYSIQNLLLKEKIRFESVIRGKIKKTVFFRKK